MKKSDKENLRKLVAELVPTSYLARELGVTENGARYKADKNQIDVYTTYTGQRFFLREDVKALKDKEQQ